jgi:hypothetical protein
MCGRSSAHVRGDAFFGLCRSNKWAVEFQRYEVAHELSDEDAEPGASEDTETLALSTGGDIDLRALVRHVPA